MSFVSPLVDYQKYVNYLVSHINGFLNPPNSLRKMDCPTPDWASEQLFILFFRLRDNLTPSYLIDSIVTKWRNYQHEINLPKEKEMILCMLKSIDSFLNGNNPVFRLSIPNSKIEFYLWIHESMKQFINTTILKKNRKIRIIANHIIDNVMLPKQSILIELDDTKEDLIWVKEHCTINILQWTNMRNLQDAIFVQVCDKKENSLFIQDDSTKVPIEVKLRIDDLDYLELLQIGDFILIWKPEMNNNKQIILNQNTVILRMPVLMEDKKIIDPYDISICGIVTNISHNVNKLEWTGCNIEILNNNQRKILFIPKSIDFNVKKLISIIRENHFIWAFHIYYNEGNSYNFNDKSTIYDLNVIDGFLSSMIATPISIHFIFNYLSGLVKGVITNITISTIIIHLDCGSSIDQSFNCSRCSIDVSGRRSRVLLYHVNIDDGSYEQFDAYGTSLTFDIFGYDANDWESQEEPIKKKLIRSFLGKEFVFFVSRANPSEFGIRDTAEHVWRIDRYLDGREENSRTIKYLVDVLRNDKPYQVGNCGNSIFQNQ